MNGFEYVRSANEFFIPRTPRAAIKAVEDGLLPDVAFIYRATSVSPIDEEPVDLGEIDRVLARPENDLDTNLLLMSIFERLLKDRDPEIALFAAESINAVEYRYNEEIESHKDELERHIDTKAVIRAHRKLAGLFYEVARINDSRPSIKRFYLTEAYGHLKDLFRSKRFIKTDLELSIEVLLSLGAPDRARFILERVTGGAKNDPDVLMLRAAVEFSAKRFERAAEMMEQVRTYSPWVNARQQELLRTWSERSNE